MSEKMNEAYMRIHNARTMLDVVVGYLEKSDDEVVETVLFALQTAREEAENAERMLCGNKP